MRNTINYTRIGYHLLFWVLFLVYRMTSSLANKSMKGDYWWGDMSVLHVLIVDVFFKAIFAYVLVYFLVPRYLDTKRYVLFGFGGIVWFYIVIAVYIAVYYYYLERLYAVYLWYDKESMATMAKRLSNLPFLLSIFSNFIFPALILGAIKFYRRKVLLAQVEEEKKKVELQALKNQLNPHFLFNTLNNLYSFVVTNSPKAPDMILRLSGVLDYVLYKSQNKSVLLQEELEAIENFIELEKIRYGDRLAVSLEKEGGMQSRVSPLLLLSLIENAFKHSASGDIEQAHIRISIQDKDHNIHCEVWNTKRKIEGELNDGYKKGIGLSNLKRQLDLVYSQRYALNILDEEKAFSVSLNLHPLP